MLGFGLTIPFMGLQAVAPPTPGQPWQVLDAAGTNYSVWGPVLDAAGATYFVSNPVLDASGVTYYPI
jgi:hypothetical protein